MSTVLRDGAPSPEGPEEAVESADPTLGNIAPPIGATGMEPVQPPPAQIVMPGLRPGPLR